MPFTLPIAIFTALAAGIFALIFKRWTTLSKFSSFIALGISGIAATYTGLQTLIIPTSASHILPLTYKISSGFPQITYQFQLDNLSGFFLCIIGLIVISIAIYGPRYLRSYEKHRSIISMTFFTGLFIGSMYLVLLAADVFSFMLAWELMSISSYFLVVYNHEYTENRSAGLTYLIMAHASGLLILLGYTTILKFSNSSDFSFATLQTTALILTPTWATIAFLCAFAGFGMKAGLVPLHVWLPRAHPVAPSHISALMSGVMLKVAIYGFLRFCFDLLKNIHWQWGVLVLFVGTLSAVLGVLYALMQHDLKKLLAYHSVENIGIIFIGIGLSLIFINTGHPTLAALGIIAALYHCLNHALFKSLLFLGAGAILQNSNEHDLEKMGGLIHKMPYTALFFLVGCISISALPPFNGFVSEWLTFQTALQATSLQSSILRTIIPIAAALLALTGALAAACFAKVYGIAFLGRPRSPQVANAKDASFSMHLAIGFLALLCLAFGIFPTTTINIINVIAFNLVGTGINSTTNTINNWLWLIQLSPNTSTYSAPIICGSIILIYLLIFPVFRLIYNHVNSKKVKPWACGFGELNERMQYSATAFAMPLRRVFKGAWPVREKIEKNEFNLSYSLHIGDWSWDYFYLPLINYIDALARTVARIQGGNIRVYLAYAFFTLIILLWIIS